MNDYIKLPKSDDHRNHGDPRALLTDELERGMSSAQCDFDVLRTRAHATECSMCVSISLIGFLSGVMGECARIAQANGANITVSVRSIMNMMAKHCSLSATDVADAIEMFDTRDCVSRPSGEAS